MIWQEGTPKPGQIIRTKVSFYYHYGIFVSENEVIQFGLPNDPLRPSAEIQVLTSNVYTFIGEGSLEIGTPSVKEKKSMRSAKEIVDLARSRLGEGGYDILHNNCEHFANQCVFTEAKESFVDEVRKSLRKKLGK